MSDSSPPWADVLAFWFAPGMKERWFVKDAAFDAEVRSRLGAMHETARSGSLDDWKNEPRGCLALCLLLDQVPRNLYRDDPRAFSCDALAQAVTRHAIDRGFDRKLEQVERLFLYLPLEHAEDLELQEECVRLTRELDEEPDWLDYAVRHRDIIQRFGRFPHRNAVLGRESDAEETAFLQEDGSSF